VESAPVAIDLFADRHPLANGERLAQLVLVMLAEGDVLDVD
jgi:hypothetical protein